MPKFRVILVRIFPWSDWIWTYSYQISVFSSSTQKYGREKLSQLTWWVFESIIISPGEFIFVGKLRNDNFLWKLYCSSTNFNVFVFQSQFHAYCLVWAFRKAIRRSSAFPPFYRDFYRLLFAASKVTRYQACYLFFKLIKHVLVTLATAFNDNF